MNVLAGWIESLDGQSLAVFIDCDRDAYYEQAIQNAAIISRGSTPIAAIPPGTPSLGEPMTSPHQAASAMRAAGLDLPDWLEVVTGIDQGTLSEASGAARQDPPIFEHICCSRIGVLLCQ